MSNEQYEIEKTNAYLLIASCLLHIFYVLFLLPVIHFSVIAI